MEPPVSVQSVSDGALAIVVNAGPGNTGDKIDWCFAELCS
jgi:hypothetical protein